MALPEHPQQQPIPAGTAAAGGEPRPPRRRSWRISGISHATVVAYLALFMAMSGTAVAATGGSFILGRSNTADRVSTLTNSTGPALSLRSPSGSPPLEVNRNVKVDRLNADLLDGLDSTRFARLGTSNSGARTTLSNPDGVPLRLTAKAGTAPLQVNSATRVANLNADLLDGRDSSQFVAKADYDKLAARVTELEDLLSGVSRVQVDGQPTVRFSGVNVQIVNGLGATTSSNGRGNLLIGYNAQRHTPASRDGSHYVVVGDQHQWTRFGGIVAGWHNTVTGDWASVSGGFDNVARGPYSSVSGGVNNDSAGPWTSVVGGDSNRASGYGATVSGGYHNVANGDRASILGGSSKTVSGANACHPNCP